MVNQRAQVLKAAIGGARHLPEGQCPPRARSARRSCILRSLHLLIRSPIKRRTKRNMPAAQPHRRYALTTFGVARPPMTPSKAKNIPGEDSREHARDVLAPIATILVIGAVAQKTFGAYPVRVCRPGRSQPDTCACQYSAPRRKGPL